MLIFWKPHRPAGPQIDWTAGSIRVQDPALFDARNDALLRRFTDAVFQATEVQAIRLDRRLGVATIEFDRRFTPAEILEKLSRLIVGETIRPGASRPDALQLPVAGAAQKVMPSQRPLRRASWVGLRRLMYLACAGVSFVLSIIGVLIPGIPTVPFLLLTSYFLVHSSPALNRRLMRTRLFGPILGDWRTHGGMRREIKLAAFMFMALMLALSIVLGGLSGVGLLVVLICSTIGVYAIARTPTIRPWIPDRQPEFQSLGLAAGGEP